jgi:amino acid transporter
MVGLWVPVAVNLAGVRQMAWFQNVTVVLKFLPLLFVGVAAQAPVGPGPEPSPALVSGTVPSRARAGSAALHRCETAG